jgi:cell division protein ZapA
MSPKDNVTTVAVLDRVYKVKCPQDEVPSLRESVAYLNEQMKNLAPSNQVSVTDTLAVVTALNLCKEIQKLNARIDALKNRIDEAVVAPFVS